MSRPSVLILVVAALGAASVATVFAAASRARGRQGPPRTTTTTIEQTVTQAPRLTPVSQAPRTTKPAPAFAIAQVKAGHTIPLRSKPNGHVLAQVGATTE